MRRITRARPSPALLVAVMALVAALAGTAVAEQATTSAVTKKKVKKIADKRIDKANLLPDNVAYVSSAPVTIANGTFGSTRAACPAGQTVVGGGASTDYAGDNAEVEASYPSSATTVPSEIAGQTVNALGTDGWTVSVENNGVDALNFRAQAICVQGVANPAISGTPFKAPLSSGGSGNR